MLTGYSFFFHIFLQFLHFFTINLHYFYDSKTYQKCFVFNIHGVSMKIYWNNKLPVFLPFWVKDTHFWKDVWIHADFLKSTTFSVLFRRDFPHHFSHIQAVANWNADNRQSYDPKTSGEGLVCWAEHSCSFLMIRKWTNHEMSWALSPGGRHKPQVLWGTQDRGSFTSRRSLVLLWDSGPHLGSSRTRRHPPTPRPSDFRGILGLWFFSRMV